ncbi:MAG: hypothetical protein Tsb002_21000 [Wenzhouxiangellaceae bacterium]
MGNLSVRKIDDEVIERLRQRAAQHGVSMEEEVRRIIEQAVSGPEKLGDFAVALFGEASGADLELPAREVYEPVELAD